MKKISLDLIVVVFAALLLIAGVTLSYMAFYKIKPTEISDSKERQEFLDQELKQQGKVSYYVLPKIQTNIEHHSSRLIQAEMTVALEPGSGIKC
jgi:flagellar basal body-associated protein FliL